MTDSYQQLVADIERLTWYIRGIVALFVIAIIATFVLLFVLKEGKDDE